MEQQNNAEMFGVNIMVACEFYRKHLDRCRKYQKENAEKQNERNRGQFQKLKADPEKYEIYKAEKREKMKAKREAEAQQKKTNPV